MEHWELSARESIRDLVARYNANGDSGRFDPMLALFAEDATMELPDQVCRGRGEIRAFLEGIARGTGRGHGGDTANGNARGSDRNGRFFDGPLGGCYKRTEQ